MWTLIAVALTAPPSLACVALVTTDGGAVPTSDAQQVILESTSGGTVVEYANRYTGTAEDFGWIIVIPAPFESMVDGDLARFERLTALSQPRIEMMSYGSSGDDGGGWMRWCCHVEVWRWRSCGGFGDTGTNDVDIIAEGFTGTYDYTVVESDDADGLVEWLEGNDWVLGANEAALTEYVDEGGFRSCLVVPLPEVPWRLASGTLPPVRIASGSSELMFPARMARDAAPEFQSTRLLVLGDQQAELTGAWSSVDLTRVGGGDGRAEAILESAIWGATSDSATYARLFSGETDEGWLTLRRPAPTVMYTRAT